MEIGKNSHKGLKICGGVSILLLIIVLVVLVIVFLTVLKPKEPKIISHPVSLRSIVLVVFPVIKLNVSLGILATIDNHNYGSFKYENSTAYVSYHGTVVAEASIEHDTIPARGKHNISTTLDIIADKLISNPYFSIDYASGCLNFTSSSTLHGKVSVFKFLKMKATSHGTCNISVFVQAKRADSVCRSRVNF